MRTNSGDMAMVLADPRSGTFLVSRRLVSVAVASAVLVDLAARGRITMQTQDRVATSMPRTFDDPIVVSSSEPVGCVWLDKALSDLVAMAAPTSVKKVLETSARSWTDIVFLGLTESGVLHRRKGRRFFNSDLWQPHPGHRQIIVDQVRLVLAGSMDADEHTGPLIALLSDLGLITSLFGDDPAYVTNADDIAAEPQWWSAEAANDAENIVRLTSTFITIS